MGIVKWHVDPSHSNIEFSVKHMMIAKVKGTFHNFKADIEADPADLTTAKIEVTIEAESIDTRNSDRDNHLRSADFFEIEKTPQIVFTATSITKTGDGEYKIAGDLTMHGQTHLEVFTTAFEGSGKDPWGSEKVGFSAEGVIKRSRYGLTYNAALETGGFLIGDDIKFTLDIEASRID